VIEALGDKDKQLSQLIDASNAVFAVFAKQEKNVESLLNLLPGALAKTRKGLGRLAVAANVLGPTLHKLQALSRSARPRQRSHAQAVDRDDTDLQDPDPAVRARNRAGREGTQARHRAALRSVPETHEQLLVLNEFFNELAFNPGAKQAGFLFFLDWGQPQPQQRAQHRRGPRRARSQRHLPQLQSRAAASKAQGKLNPTVNLLIGLLNPPGEAECISEGINKAAGAKAASAQFGSKAPTGGLFSGLTSVFGNAPAGVGHAAATGCAGGRCLSHAEAALPPSATCSWIVLFCLSCFGLLLFLWESFGGPLPFKPTGIA